MDDITGTAGQITPTSYPVRGTPHPVPITVCTPAWLGVTLNLMRQRVTPTGPFLDLLNRFPLKQLEEERDKVAGQIAQLNTARQLLDLAISARKTDGSTQIIAVGQAKTTESALPITPAIGGRPPLKQAILAVLADGENGYQWTPKEIHAELENRGWAPTTAAARAQISNRLSNLVESGQVLKPEKGLYVLVRGD
jgi:hypothetical protein